jgi:hypothetical protein
MATRYICLCLAFLENCIFASGAVQDKIIFLISNKLVLLKPLGASKYTESIQDKAPN